MFLIIFINAIFWLLVCKISFFFSKFTTIAKYSWFQDSVFALEKMAKHKLKSEKLAQFILNRSYSKIFYCRPCHCFWISLGLFFALFRYQLINYAFIMSFILAFIVYLMAKGLDVEEQNKR